MNTNNYNGKASKLNVLITTGIHGNEITPIETCRILKYKIENKWTDILNSVRSLNICYGINNDALDECSRNVNKNDSTDLNRDWGYKETQEDIRKKIYDFVSNADMVIDIHSSPNISECFLVDSDRNQMGIYYWLKENKIPYILWKTAPYGTLKSYVNRCNKIGLTLELNGIDSIDYASAEKGVELIENVIKGYFSILEYKTHEIVYPKENEYAMSITSNFRGIFISIVKPGEIVFPEQKIGIIENMSEKNNILGEVFSPIHGKVIEINNKSFVNYRTELYGIQPIIV